MGFEPLLSHQPEGSVQIGSGVPESVLPDYTITHYVCRVCCACCACCAIIITDQITIVKLVCWDV